MTKFFGALTLALCTVVIAGCETSSVVMSGTADGGQIANGASYDQAVLPVGNIQLLIVPDNAKVLATATDNQIHLRIKKILAWTGHALIPTDIRYERFKMGCGIRRDGDTVTIATYGEWYGKAEGGATIELTVVVPAGLKVEARKGLSGFDSPVEIQEPMFDSLQSRPVAAGWTKIKDQPDPTKGLMP